MMHSKGEQSKIIPDTRYQISVKLRFCGSDIRYQLRFCSSDIRYQSRFCGSKIFKQQDWITSSLKKTIAQAKCILKRTKLASKRTETKHSKENKMHSKGEQSKIIPDTRYQISVKVLWLRYQISVKVLWLKNLDDLSLKQQRQIKEREERTLAKGSMLMSNSDLGWNLVSTRVHLFNQPLSDLKQTYHQTTRLNYI